MKVIVTFEQIWDIDTEGLEGSIEDLEDFALNETKQIIGDNLEDYTITEKDFKYEIFK